MACRATETACGMAAESARREKKGAFIAVADCSSCSGGSDSEPGVSIFPKELQRVLQPLASAGII